ncbi:MAG: nitrogen regulation protein NR(I), partial [Myxococcota bacterium]
MNSVIWLVDDDEAEHEMLRIAFERVGDKLDIRGFYSAEEAVCALNDGESPSLILLDLNMPGLGGF